MHPTFAARVGLALALTASLIPFTSVARGYDDYDNNDTSAKHSMYGGRRSSTHARVTAKFTKKFNKLFKKFDFPKYDDRDDKDDRDDRYDDERDEKFKASLNGQQENPSVNTNGWGSGKFHLEGNTLHYEIDVQNLSSAMTAAHFHLGATGVNGPVIASIGFVGNHAAGQWVGLTNQQIQDLKDDKIYVNVHTTNYPNGEIRGQVY
ncbi:MAG: CHRD domain-containing protein [Candidatus Peregrinibacteria bacterium]|nr:CHRD domain-containing protein [Candidatus Peregrinibacteria bacterium]